MLWAQEGFCIHCSHLQPCCARGGGTTIPFICSGLASKSDGKDPTLKPPSSKPLPFLPSLGGAEPHHPHGKHCKKNKHFFLSGWGEGEKKKALARSFFPPCSDNTAVRAKDAAMVQRGFIFIF